MKIDAKRKGQFQNDRVCKLPKMYIIRKLLSTAKPEMKRDSENMGTFVVNTVIPLPISAIILANIKTGSRPIESAIAPNICVPNTDPTKNIDWPIVDFHAESHTQFNCFNKYFFIKKHEIGKQQHLFIKLLTSLLMLL